MTRTRHFGLIATILILMACAGSNQAGSTSSAPPPSAGGASPETPGVERHPPMPPAMVAFHDVLRPLWHSDPGAERDRRTCTQSQLLRQRAEELANAPAPAEVQARANSWMTSTAQLVATVQQLETTCRASAAVGVASALEAVHRAFHNLLDLLRGAER